MSQLAASTFAVPFIVKVWLRAANATVSPNTATTSATKLSTFIFLFPLIPSPYLLFYMLIIAYTPPPAVKWIGCL